MLSNSFCTISFRIGQHVWFWEGLQNIRSNNTFFSQHFTDSDGGGEGRSAAMIMVVEREDATGS
jgi:hypothetical protein